MPAIEIMPDFRQLIIQLISLVFLFFMFKRYGWQPMKAFLDKRQEIVSAQFKEAEAIKADALILKSTYEQHMSNAEEDGQRIIEASRDQGKQVYDEIVSEAQKNAEQKLAKAAVAIEQDKKNAHDKIKEEIIDITMSGVEQMIKKEMDAEIHEQLFADFVAKVGDGSGE